MTKSILEGMQIRKNQGISAENVPIGPKLAEIVGQTNVGGALYALSQADLKLMSANVKVFEYAKSLEAKIEALEKKLDAHKHNDLQIRIFEVEATTNLNADSPIRAPFFFDKDSNRWWSVETITINFARNAAAYTGWLRMENGVASSLAHYSGYHIPFQSAVIGLTVAQSSTTVNDQEVDLYVSSATPSHTHRFTDLAARESTFFKLENALDLDPDHAARSVQVNVNNTFPAAGPVPMDYPRVSVYLKMYKTLTEKGNPDSVPVPERYF